MFNKVLCIYCECSVLIKMFYVHYKVLYIHCELLMFPEVLYIYSKVLHIHCTLLMITEVLYIHSKVLHIHCTWLMFAEILYIHCLKNSTFTKSLQCSHDYRVISWPWHLASANVKPPRGDIYDWPVTPGGKFLGILGCHRRSNSRLPYLKPICSF